MVPFIPPFVPPIAPESSSSSSGIASALGSAIGAGLVFNALNMLNGKIIHYKKSLRAKKIFCNTKRNATKQNSTTNLKKVTCKKCLKIIKRKIKGKKND